MTHRAIILSACRPIPVVPTLVRSRSLMLQSHPQLKLSSSQVKEYFRGFLM